MFIYVYIHRIPPCVRTLPIVWKIRRIFRGSREKKSMNTRAQKPSLRRKSHARGSSWSCGAIPLKFFFLPKEKLAQFFWLLILHVHIFRFCFLLFSLTFIALYTWFFFVFSRMFCVNSCRMARWDFAPLTPENFSRVSFSLLPLFADTAILMIFWIRCQIFAKQIFSLLNAPQIFRK